MTTIVLDAGPLGLVIHANPKNKKALECALWLKVLLLNENVNVIIPEISDYEVRRSLLKIESTKSIRKLDKLNSALSYLPINTPAMRKVAEFWAEARKQGKQTADNLALDGDMVLVGQVNQLQEIQNDDVIVATTNVRHIELFAEARNWVEITTEELN